MTLRGEGQWQDQRAEVERSIRKLAGVQNVSNTIAIKPHQVDAADTKQQVGDAIKRMAAIDARSVLTAALGIRPPDGWRSGAAIAGASAVAGCL
ncbi:MAG: hypothetical protein M3Y09_15165 [Actinomycetota bacterium]|nr:hypothetical protein [Actinomycetota bacterium]